MGISFRKIFDSLFGTREMRVRLSRETATDDVFDVDGFFS